MTGEFVAVDCYERLQVRSPEVVSETTMASNIGSKIAQRSSVIMIGLLGSVLAEGAVAQSLGGYESASAVSTPELAEAEIHGDAATASLPSQPERDVDSSINAQNPPPPPVGNTAPLPPPTPVAPGRVVPPFTQRVDSAADTDLTSYVLGPGDQLGISVIGFEELERERIILPDGTILMPLIGSVVAAGKTPETLELELTRRLSFYLVDPVVELNLNTLRPVVVTVGGEVSRPGPVQLNSLSTFNTRVNNNQLSTETTSPTISTALVGAGGVLRTADLRNISVQRQLPDGSETVLSINLWESIFLGQGDDNILLQDGDVVFVPEAPAETVAINPYLVARSSLAPDTIEVQVIGEVGNPGGVALPPDGTVSSALALAGGYDLDTANLSQVALVRLQENGQVEEQIIDMNANLVDDTPIQDGDIIVVPKRGYLNVLDTVSRTLSPIAAPFNFFLLFDRLFNSN